MTINLSTTKISYDGNGSTTAFIYTFKILEDDDLLVIVKDSTGVETTLTLNSDYTVSGAGDESGGTVTLTSGSLCDTGEELHIFRSMDLLQETDYVDGDAFSAESFEAALDKQTMILQELDERVDRSVAFPKTGETITNEIDGVEFVNRANKGIGFDTDGDLALLPTSLATVTVASAAWINVADSPYNGSLTAVVAAVGGTETIVLIDSVATLSAITTVPANIQLIVTVKGRINQSTYTLAINGSFSAQGQVFTGTGAITFGKYLEAPPIKLWASATDVTFPTGQTVYVAWWGESETDNGSLFQKAIDSLNPGTLTDSGGTVIYTKDLLIDTQVTVGDYSTLGNILITSTCSPIYSCRIIAGATIGTTPLFYVLGAGVKFDNVNISGDGTVEGGDDATTVGIKVGAGDDATENPDEFTITNSVIAKCETGIEINSRNFIIRDNIFSWALNPISIPGLEGSGPYTYTDRRDYFIERNNFHVCNGTCVALTGTNPHSEVTIKDNMFKTVLNGINGAIEDSSISGNIFNNIKGEAINIITHASYSGAYGNTISDNRISGYQGVGGNTGDAITVYAPFPNINNNKVNRKTGNGIVVVADNAIISNNSVQKSTSNGISLAGDYAVISGNHVLDSDNSNTDTYSGIAVAGDRNIISGNISGNTSNTPGSGVGGQLYGIVISSGTSNSIGSNSLIFNKTSQMSDGGTSTVGLVGEGLSRRLLFGTAAPAAGTWAVGDRVINKAPAAGQPKAWACTVAGTPGTWVSEGNL